MCKQRLTILIVAAVGMLATFLPWVNFVFGSMNGTKGDGWITLALFAIPLILSLLKDKSKPLSGGLLFVAIIPPILSCIFGIWKIISFYSKMPSGNPFASSASIGIGLYLVVLTGIALPILAFALKAKEAENTVITKQNN